jgi:hypothetical protein
VVVRKSDGLQVSQSFSFWESPLIVMAAFDSTGSYISIKFTSPTNRMGMPVLPASGCDALFAQTSTLGTFMIDVSQPHL